MKRAASLIVALGFALPACSSAPVPCSTDNECVGGAANVCDAADRVCVESAPRATLIGKGDGSAGSVGLTVAFESDPGRRFTGFGFNPLRPNEMWVVDQSDNSVFIVTDPGTPQVASIRKRDPAAGHFMAKPTGMSFAEDGSWGTCGETDNSQNGGTDFMGPATFSSNATIFAKSTGGGLGSHLDMLHNSPFCMGIVHDVGHRFWVFDGTHGAAVRYDFMEYHEPGADDHSDGEIRVYGDGVLSRVEGIPSHLALDHASGLLYIADTGNKRVARLDTRQGTPGAELDTFEPSVPVQMDGVVLSDFVPAGVFEAPSGIAFADQAIYVSDNATGKISAYAVDGQLARHLDTGVGAGAIAALVIGPDGKLYFSDLGGARIYRIDVP